MTEPNTRRRVVEIKGRHIGPSEPRAAQLNPRKVSDYLGVPAACLEVARKLSSPLIGGPPICDELIAFVCHVFTEDEASVVRHLGVFRGRSAEDVAHAEHRRVEEVRPILCRLADEKRAIGSDGAAAAPRYRLMPILPGIYEMVLIGQTPETLTPWHRRFIELAEALFETGFNTEYAGRRTPLIRFLSVGRALEGQPLALPSDRLEVVLERFRVFGVGHCQCRLSAQALGRGCGKPLGNCTVMGAWAEAGIRSGWLQSATREEVLAIKREAETHGLVTWIMNVESARGQASCSCCGCCCKAMRIVNEFNAPGMMAPPHFMPRFDLAKCTFCGHCARHCPMGALAVDAAAKTHAQRAERCIGCGLCLLACDRAHAIAMEPVPDYKLPYKSWFAMLMGTAPQTLRASWKVWRKYR